MTNQSFAAPHGVKSSSVSWST